MKLEVWEQESTNQWVTTQWVYTLYHLQPSHPACCYWLGVYTPTAGVQGLCRYRNHHTQSVSLFTAAVCSLKFCRLNLTLTKKVCHSQIAKIVREEPLYWTLTLKTGKAPSTPSGCIWEPFITRSLLLSDTVPAKARSRDEAPNHLQQLFPQCSFVCCWAKAATQPGLRHIAKSLKHQLLP